MRKLIVSGFLAFMTLGTPTLMAQDSIDVEVPSAASCPLILRSATNLQQRLDQLRAVLLRQWRDRRVGQTVIQARQAVLQLENRSRATRCKNDVVQRNLGAVQTQIQAVRNTFRRTPRLVNNPRISAAYQEVLRGWQALRQSAAG